MRRRPLSLRALQSLPNRGDKSDLGLNTIRFAATYVCKGAARRFTRGNIWQSSPKTASPTSKKLGEIEGVLNTGGFPRTVFRLNPLPIIDSARVNRGELLPSIDAWIGGLR
jgi:hypothetical protein